MSTVVARPWDDRIAEVLNSWLNTPYELFRCEKGKGVDCVRHVAAVIDEMFGYARCPMHKLPPDAAFHAPRKASAAMRKFMTLYKPFEKISPAGPFESGDILVVAPTPTAGPGHAVIATPWPGCFQETGTLSVVRSGLQAIRRVHAAFRVQGREGLW